MHVYISSTFLDLQPERLQVEKVVHGMHEVKFIGMEYFGSRNENTRQASLAEIDRANVYLCIVGGRFGSGITQEEYRRARAHGLSCLVYFKDEAVIEPDQCDDDERSAQRLRAFKAELKNAHLIRGTFTNPDQLATYVALDLHRLSALSRKAQLRHDVVDFGPLIEEETRWYTGRTMLLAQVHDAVADITAGGYVSIVADAGLGKTALAAELAVRLKAPAFFCSVAGGLTTAARCLRHLSAELILRHDLPYESLPDSAGRDAAFLCKLMAEARARIQEPIVLVVDGLDEAEKPAVGQNILQLPDRLPPGCHIIITQRPTGLRLTTQGQTRLLELTIKVSQPGQRTDIELHLLRQVERPEIRRALQHMGQSAGVDVFVKKLADAAQGNFKYLAYVLEDIAEGSIREEGTPSLDTMVLPLGLRRYYEHFWQRMGMEQMPESAWSDWDRLYRPVVTLLAVAKEPISPGWLAAHCGQREEEIRARVLQPWRRFLTRRSGPTPKDETWQIVHKSFADFLYTRPELNVSAQHTLVSAWYLADQMRWTLHARYASRHLSAHLCDTGELGKLLTLIGWLDWYEWQMTTDPGASLFVTDVERAWTLAENLLTTTQDAALRVSAVTGLVQCTVMLSTLRSFSDSIDARFLEALVRSGRWTPSMALDRLERMSDSKQQATGLEAIAPLLNDISSVRRALNLFNKIVTLYLDSSVFASLLTQLSSLGLAAEVLPWCERLRSASICAEALIKCLPELDRIHRQIAMERLLVWIGNEDTENYNNSKIYLTISLEHHGFDKFDQLSQSADSFDLEKLNEWLQRHSCPNPKIHARRLCALAARRVLPNEHSALESFERDHAFEHRIHWLPSLIDAADPDLRRTWSCRILDEACRIGNTNLSYSAIAALAQIARHAATEVVEDWIDRMQPSEMARHLLWAEKIISVAPCMSRRQVQQTFRALSEKNLPKEGRRTSVYAALAIRTLELDGVEAALTIKHQVGDCHEVSIFLLTLLAPLARYGHETTVLEILRHHILYSDGFRSDGISIAANYFDAKGCEELIAISNCIGDIRPRSKALSAVAAQFARLGHIERALQIVRFIGDGRRGLDRIFTEIARAACVTGEGSIALTMLLRIDDTDWKARSFELLAEKFPKEILGQASQYIVGIHNSSGSTNSWGNSCWNFSSNRAVSAILPRLAREGQIQMALKLAESLIEPALSMKIQLLVCAQLPASSAQAAQCAILSILPELPNPSDINCRSFIDALEDAADGIRPAAARVAIDWLEKYSASLPKYYLASQMVPAMPELLGQLAACGHASEALNLLVGDTQVLYITCAKLASDLVKGGDQCTQTELRHLLLESAKSQINSKVDVCTLIQAAAPLFINANPIDQENFANFLLQLIYSADRDETIFTIVEIATPFINLSDTLRVAKILPKETFPKIHEDIQQSTWLAVWTRLIAHQGATETWKIAQENLYWPDRSIPSCGALQALAPVADDFLLADLLLAAKNPLPEHKKLWDKARASVARRAIELFRTDEAVSLLREADPDEEALVAAVAPIADIYTVRQLLEVRQRRSFSTFTVACRELLLRQVKLGYISEAIDGVCGAHWGYKERGFALKTIVKSTATESTAILQAALMQVLHTASRRNRALALEDIAEIVPWLARAGGVSALESIADQLTANHATWP